MVHITNIPQQSSLNSRQLYLADPSCSAESDEHHALADGAEDATKWMELAHYHQSVCSRAQQTVGAFVAFVQHDQRMD